MKRDPQNAIIKNVRNGKKEYGYCLRLVNEVAEQLEDEEMLYAEDTKDGYFLIRLATKREQLEDLHRWSKKKGLKYNSADTLQKYLNEVNVVLKGC